MKKKLFLLTAVILCFIAVSASAYIEGEKYRWYCAGCRTELAQDGPCPYCGETKRNEVPTINCQGTWSNVAATQTDNGYTVTAVFTTQQAGDVLYDVAAEKCYLEFKTALLKDGKVLDSNTLKAYSTGKWTSDYQEIFEAKIVFNLPVTASQGTYSIWLYDFVPSVHDGPYYEKAETTVTVGEPNAKPYLKTEIIWVGRADECAPIVENVPEGALYGDVYSSDESVILPVRRFEGFYFDGGDYLLKALKPGKAKITVNYYLNGKNYKVSAKYTAKLYPFPFDYFTLDGKKISSKSLKSYTYRVSGYKGTKPVIKIKQKKGWNVFLSVTSDKLGSKTDKYYREFTVTNGKSFKLPKKHEAEVSCVFEKDTGERVYFRINIDR